MKEAFPAESVPMSRPAAVRVARPRRVEQVLEGEEMRDGAGVLIHRFIHTGLQRRLDPWLQFDVFASDNPDEYIGGYPDHPQRGFESLLYLLEGRMRHRDSAGQDHLLGPGDAHWVNAGRGVLRSDLPDQDQGRMEGVIAWLNLPSRDKMSEPASLALPSDAIVEYEREGVLVRVLAGSSHGVDGCVLRPEVHALALDLHLDPGTRFMQPIPDTHNVFIYVHAGDLVVGGTPVAAGRMALLDRLPRRDGVSLRTGAKSWASALLLAGKPLEEPIIQYGPFVMNTREQVQEAVDDYQAGRLP